jgi:hypothetical protein
MVIYKSYTKMHDQKNIKICIVFLHTVANFTRLLL